MRKVERLIIIITLNRILHLFKNEIQQIRLEINRQKSQRFVALMLAKQWRIRYRKFNSSDEILRNKIRFSMTFYTRNTSQTTHNHALKVLSWTFNVCFKMIVKNQRLFHSVKFMQDQHSNRQSSLAAKTEILDNYWNKMLTQLVMANSQIRSNKMSDLISDI